MRKSIPECPMCGTWVCAQCGWKRLGANADPAWKHACHRCGGTRGVLIPARHRNEWIRADHAAAALERPMTEMTQARRVLDDLGRTVVALYGPPDPTSFTGKPSVDRKRLDELTPQLFTLAERLLLMVEEMEQFSEDVAGAPALLAAVSSQKLRGLIEEVLL